MASLDILLSTYGEEDLITIMYTLLEAG